MDDQSEIITGEITLADPNLMGDFETSEPLENNASDQDMYVSNEEGSYDDDGDDNDEDDDNEENDHFSVKKQGEQTSTKIDKTKSKKPGKKRKRVESHKRRNIRKVLRIDQLDPRTLEAQKEEQERLQRLELQRSLSFKKPSTSVCADNFSPGKVTADLNESNDAILIEDDVEYVDDYDGDSDDDYESEGSRTENVILISSSDSEGMDSADERMDSADEDVNLRALSNLKPENGKVLVNPSHLPEEPDIFLPGQVAKTIKPHQVRFDTLNIYRKTCISRMAESQTGKLYYVRQERMWFSTLATQLAINKGSIALSYE